MSESSGVSVQERLAEFYRRLRGAPAANSADEAFQQICDTLVEVENELSGITKQSPPPPIDAPDGRMYPPLDDFVERKDDGSISAMTRGHALEIGNNGEIVIRSGRANEVEFVKDGGTD